MSMSERKLAIWWNKRVKDKADERHRMCGLFGDQKDDAGNKDLLCGREESRERDKGVKGRLLGCLVGRRKRTLLQVDPLKGFFGTRKGVGSIVSQIILKRDSLTIVMFIIIIVSFNSMPLFN